MTWTLLAIGGALALAGAPWPDAAAARGSRWPSARPRRAATARRRWRRRPAPPSARSVACALPEAAGHHRGRLPGGGHRRQGDRGLHAAAVHAPRRHGRLRRRQLAADRRHPRRASCCASASARRSCASTTTTTTPSAGRAWRARATATVAWTTTVASVLVAANAATVSRLAARLSRPAAARLRRRRPVGVHQPRDGLRAAARRRARPRVPDRLDEQRGDDGRLHRHRSSCSPTRARGACCSATSAPRRSSCSGCGAWCCAGASRWRVRRDELGPMLRFGLPTVPADASVYAPAGRRPLLPAARGQPVGGGPLRRRACSWPPWCSSRCADSSTPGPRWPTRSRATRRRRGCTRSSPPTSCSAPASSSPASRCSARWMVRLLLAPQFFGALPGAAVAGARLVAVRPVPRAAGDRRPRARHLAQLPRGGAPAWSPTCCCSCCSSPPAAPDLGIAGAGIALCGAYVVMLVVFHLLTRNLFRVAFEWRRLALLAAILAGVSVSRRAAAAHQWSRRPRHARGLAGVRAGAARADALLPAQNEQSRTRARAASQGGAAAPRRLRALHGESRPGEDRAAVQLHRARAGRPRPPGLRPARL